ncbi:NAD(P)/FAD-dependent oxidoreductase [Microbacterium sp. cf332]|uniref:protoporphyrinogen/coproporphyrinogen oxidase n=1 Tax=Microbacterium sp. cf332 TaxID=1761804 RepID=UPI00088D7DFE|nr:FAD-dependent oxidoreductase [Microbacterium sp. cf332]SDQ66649.1 oxygen-dependent protoporphyrinogen oxidase [Microbacterium sp. cf332]
MTDLAQHAHDTRVVVVGGGIAGIVAALECARLGLRVTLLEAAPHLGGSLDRVALGGIVVDAAADGIPASAQTLTALVDEVGLADELETPRDDRLWLAAGPRGAAPAPAETVLGIPANPWADDVRRHIETRGAWRAYVDRLRPPLTVGRRRSLGDLVESRMGARVRDRLVAPYVLAVHGVAPEFIDVDAAAPSLNPALTRTGSLSGAVAQTLRSGSPPRSAPRGGLHRLVDALAARLRDFDVDIRTGSRVSAVRRDGGGTGWLVATDGASEEVGADLLVLASDEDATRALLAPHLTLPPSAGPRPDPLETVMLRIAGVPLPARGSLVVGGGPAPATVRPVSQTWPSLRDALPAGEEVLRVTQPPTAGDDREAVAAACRAASDLFGVGIGEPAVRAAARVVYSRAAPASLLGHAEAVAAIRDRARTVAGLALVGGWLSGNSLERVAADAVAEAATARHAVLWREQGRP